MGKKEHIEIWKPESARKKQDVLHLQTLSEKTLGKKKWQSYSPRVSKSEELILPLLKLAVSGRAVKKGRKKGGIFFCVSRVSGKFSSTAVWL